MRSAAPRVAPLDAARRLAATEPAVYVVKNGPFADSFVYHWSGSGRGREMPGRIGRKIGPWPVLGDRLLPCRSATARAAFV